MESYKLEIGSTLSGQNHPDQEQTLSYATLQYIFKPSSVENQKGKLLVSSGGNTELIFQPNPEAAHSGDGQMVKLGGATIQQDTSHIRRNGFTDCVLIIEELVTDTGTRSVARLEQVGAAVSGLRFDRATEYENSELARKRVYSKASMRSASANIASAASKLRKSKSNPDVPLEIQVQEGAKAAVKPKRRKKGESTSGSLPVPEPEPVSDQPSAVPLSSVVAATSDSSG